MTTKQLLAALALASVAAVTMRLLALAHKRRAHRPRGPVCALESRAG